MYRQTSELSLLFNLSDIQSIAPLGLRRDKRSSLSIPRSPGVAIPGNEKRTVSLPRATGEKNGELTLPGQAAQPALQVHLPQDASPWY